MDAYSLHELGWQPFFEQQVSTKEKDQLLIARVAAHFGGRIPFLTCKGEIDVPTAIVTTSKVAGPNDDQSGEAPRIAVGDWFLLDKVNHRALRRLERKTLISRKAAGEEVKPQLIAANVDTLFIVSSCNQDFNLSRVERYLALALESDANPVLILTKADM